MMDLRNELARLQALVSSAELALEEEHEAGLKLALSDLSTSSLRILVEVSSW